MDNTTLYFHMPKHLGDSIFCCILFYNIQNYLTDNNIIIYYYACNEYLYQIQEFIQDTNNVKLFDILHKPTNSISLWIGDNYWEQSNIYRYYKNNQNCYLNDFLVHFFNCVLLHINIPITMPTFTYSSNDLLNRYNNLDAKYANVDILILNSVPCSNQYHYDKTIWDNYIVELNQIYKIVTISKVTNVLSTADDNLTIKTIAAISTHAKVIIAINSGPFVGCLNKYTLNNVLKCYIFDKDFRYSYPKFEHKMLDIRDITIEELNNALL